METRQLVAESYAYTNFDLSYFEVTSNYLMVIAYHEGYLVSDGIAIQLTII